MRRILLIASLFLVVFVRFELQACSCFPPLTVQEAFESAEAVFEAEVVGTEVDYDTFTRFFDVRVLQSWKGITGTDVAFSTALDSAACGVLFEIGDRTIFYAHDSGDGTLKVNLCSRTALEPVAGDPDELASLHIETIELTAGADPLYPPLTSTTPGAPGGFCGTFGAVSSAGMILMMWCARCVRRVRRTG